MLSMKNPQAILSWKAPLRPYKKKAGRVLRFYLAITLLLSLIIYFIGDKILLIPVWAVVFLFYILTITPPPTIDNIITKFGVETGGITIRWESFSYFYLSSRFNYKMITLVGHPPYNPHVYLILPNDKEKQKKLLDIFTKKLIYKQKPHHDLVEKATSLFLSLVPDDSEEEVVNEKKVSPPVPPLPQKDAPNESLLRRMLLNKPPTP